MYHIYMYLYIYHIYVGKVAYICVHLNKIGLFAFALGPHYDSDCINNIHTDGNLSKTTFLILGDLKKMDISTKLIV